MMDIIIDFDDDDPRGYRTITVRDYPVDPNADPDPTQVSPEYWCQFAEAVCVAVLHNMKNEIQKVRLADYNIQEGNWADRHLRACRLCRNEIRRGLRETNI
jgi:hypothetical protein